jgi:C1A family cysteine protease
MTQRNYPVKLCKPNPLHQKYNAATPVVIPNLVDWTSQFPPTDDQEQTSSCTAHGICGHLERLEIVQKETYVKLSRDFVYYGERDIEHDVNKDAGAIIANGIHFVCTAGAAPEAIWQFSAQDLFAKPSMEAYKEAAAHKGLQPFAIGQSATDIQHALASGNTIIFGISVFSSLESNEVARTGLVPMPSTHDEAMGGHCIVLVGYDRIKKLYKFRNSWGPWGDNGYGYLPFDYVHDPALASDFFTIAKIS